jgi:alpha-amylase
MNIVGDFIARVNAQFPEDVDSEELSSLLKMIANQNDEIAALNKELAALKKDAPAAKKEPAKRGRKKKEE